MNRVLRIDTNIENLKKEVISHLREALRTSSKRFVTIPSRASGSASGLPFELWAKNILSEKGLRVFLQEEFVKELVRGMSGKYGPDEIRKIVREKTWYGIQDYVISKEQLEKALEGEEVPAYQQSMADLILFYGKDISNDINDVILINVKSHDIKRKSRPPNIISAKRVLEFFRDVLKQCQSMINKVDLWFLGIYYVKRSGSNAEITEVYIKDFFKLDVTKIPMINFDAAIQIQWHVKDMVENPKIDKLTFTESLAEEYLKRWEEFVDRRTRNIENLVNELIKLIREVKQKMA